MRSKHSTKIQAAQLRAEQLGAQHGAAVKRGGQAVKAVALGAAAVVAGYFSSFASKVWS